MIGGGAAVALISDAGTPLISDPGFPLVRAAQDAGHPVFAIPGRVGAAGGAVGRGAADGCVRVCRLPAAEVGGARQCDRALVERRDTLVFYESPRRLVEALRAMEDGFGHDRPAAVALELTKRFERTYRGTVASLLPGSRRSTRSRARP